MKKLAASIATLVMAASVVVTMPTANAEVIDFNNPPENAIISEGNGAAVFLGYGGDMTVNLAWRPSKQFEDAKMLYQVQRSDGAVLVSKTNTTSYADKGLLPNTAYSYTLTAYQSIEKTKKIKKGKLKGQTVKSTSVKRVGQVTITVVTLPGEVIGLYSPNNTPRFVRWQPPREQGQPLTYSIYLGANLWMTNVNALEYAFPADVNPSPKANVKVCAENISGEAKKCSTVSVVFG